EVVYYFRHWLTLPEMNSQSANTRIADHYLCIVDLYKPSRYWAYFNVPLQQQLLTMRAILKNFITQSFGVPNVQDEHMKIFYWSSG
ncbi:2984_t:CDS:1, partial [Paraglomus brasilianum]